MDRVIRWTRVPGNIDGTYADVKGRAGDLSGRTSAFASSASGSGSLARKQRLELSERSRNDGDEWAGVGRFRAVVEIGRCDGGGTSGAECDREGLRPGGEIGVGGKDRVRVRGGDLDGKVGAGGGWSDIPIRV